MLVFRNLFLVAYGEESQGRGKTDDSEGDASNDMGVILGGFLGLGKREPFPDFVVSIVRVPLFVLPVLIVVVAIPIGVIVEIV